MLAISQTSIHRGVGKTMIKEEGSTQFSMQWYWRIQAPTVLTQSKSSTHNGQKPEIDINMGICQGGTWRKAQIPSICLSFSQSVSHPPTNEWSTTWHDLVADSHGWIFEWRSPQIWAQLELPGSLLYLYTSDRNTLTMPPCRNSCSW